MPTIRNMSPGLRGVNTEDRGTVWLQPGQEADLNVSAGEMKVIQAGAQQTGLAVGGAPRTAEEGGDDAGGSTNLDDMSTTDIPQLARTINPQQFGVNPEEPETTVDDETTSVPWDTGNPTGGAMDDPQEAGEGATTGGEDGASRGRRGRG